MQRVGEDHEPRVAVHVDEARGDDAPRDVDPSTDAFRFHPRREQGQAPAIDHDVPGTSRRARPVHDGAAGQEQGRVLHRRDDAPVAGYPFGP